MIPDIWKTQLTFRDHHAVLTEGVSGHGNGHVSDMSVLQLYRNDTAVCK